MTRRLSDLLVKVSGKKRARRKQLHLPSLSGLPLIASLPSLLLIVSWPSLLLISRMKSCLLTDLFLMTYLRVWTDLRLPTLLAITLLLYSDRCPASLVQGQQAKSPAQTWILIPMRSLPTDLRLLILLKVSDQDRDTFAANLDQALSEEQTYQ